MHVGVSNKKRKTTTQELNTGMYRMDQRSITTCWLSGYIKTRLCV